MRLLKDTLVALMLVGILAGILWYNRTDRSEQAVLDAVRDDVRRFQQEILLQATLKEVELTERGYPRTVDPAWFGDDMPTNDLLGPSHPWLEIAGPEQCDLHHPPQLVAGDDSLAAYWYNPLTGSLKARVPVEISDARALRIYNYINDSGLPSLFADAGGSSEDADLP
ncbi:MAG: hypothetical protein JSV91_13070 [Phycisphaerales bacterium]|nr:MAG: hypothetical protein JSV91_13070 [Phycisphaerales bacterium]